jgi:hypothetical protein
LWVLDSLNRVWFLLSFNKEAKERTKLFFKSILKLYWHFIIYLVIVLLSICILLYLISIPFEKRGINNEKLELPLDIYIINNLTHLNDVNYFINRANDVWNKYNISLIVKNVTYSYKEIPSDEINLIFNKGDCSSINSIINNLTINNSYNVTKLIFLFNSGSINEGRACSCSEGCNFIILNNRTWKFSGWDLAHETGHILGAEKQCWKWNLMTERSSECQTHNLFYNSFQGLSFALRKLFMPKFLNQKQLDVVVDNLLKN